MRKYKLAMLLLMATVGCKDKPYGEQVGLPVSDIPTADVSKANIQKVESAAYAFSGLAELGTPISGARVAVHKFSGLML